MNTTSIELQQERATADSATVTLRDDERQRCEVWTRVMGYHRPVASFNIGKQGEFHERVHFVEAVVQ
ncbi:MAG: hypothetical protein IPJ42_02985 [Betaproteobacteria bacterium]|jgi:hypothetical protein|nr:hypothetical protein [Betaproteobacteria bacterium]MBK7275023.1 hypothetical protein [Betaproteobacteria bacterium]MBK7457395.1 hypothetical protein [Betaproteobacteria bacterium]MBK8104632.1 hypothetical protein [Betaproteobacteria bacterium]MBL0296688.1 hypothetical protein [Betaproteobacteria bacterium]